MDTVVTTAFAQKSAKIDELVDIEQARFAAARPKSRSFWAEGRKNYLYGGPSHWMRRWAGGFPIYVDHARGAELTDIDGNTYTDFCLGDTGGMCGHAHKAITEAALTQLGRGTTTMLPIEDANWVGQELERRFGLPFWTLTTSATDANRGAIRLSRMVTGRNKVLVFSGCYHGGVEEAHVEIRDGTIGLRNGIHPNGVDHSRVSKVVEFNDRDAVRAALADKDVACVLMEPMMTNFGMIPVAAGFNEFVREEIPTMRANRQGRILVTSSVSARVAFGGGAHYSAAKAGVNAFIRGAGFELARDNITVNGVEPGFIAKPGRGRMGSEHAIAALGRHIPMGRMGDADDIAHAMLFLASDEARYITGQTIVVDGGATLADAAEIASCCLFLACDEASFVTGAVLVADGGGRVPAAHRAV